MRRKAVLAALGLVIGLALAAAVMFAMPDGDAALDYTEPHGQECLDTPQGEYQRCWDLLVPEGVGTDPVPLLIDLHGFGSTAEAHADFSGSAELAEAVGFLVAWPYGVERSWNGGGDGWPTDKDINQVAGSGCCGVALNDDIDDVGFLRDLVAQVSRSHAVDQDQVFLTGFSNGCFLAQRAALEASDVFDGVACIAGMSVTDTPADYTPVPMLALHGTADVVVSYEADFWIGAEQNAELWMERNGCSEPLEMKWEVGAHIMEESSGCEGGAAVGLLSLGDAPHLAYDAPGLESDIPAIMWGFLISNT